MNQIKRTLIMFMAVVCVMAGVLGSVTAKATVLTTPIINYLGVDHSPLVVGDSEKFTVTSKYEGLVQYRAFLFDGKKWSELTSGYSAAVDAKTPYVLPETSAFKLGKYKLTVWVKRAGTAGINAEGYDNYYTAALNCVSRDNANRVYANGDAKVETNGLTVKVKGIENIGGIKGPYLYRLFIFNPTTGRWINGAKEYTETSSYTFSEVGTYMVIAHINTVNSTTWKNYKSGQTKGAYEAWKTIIVTVKDDGTVKVLDTSVAPTTFGSTVNVTLTDEGGAIFATAVKYQIFDGTKELSAMAKLGTDISISEAKSFGDKVRVKLFDASEKEVKDIEAFLGTPVAIPEFKYAIQAEVGSMGILSEGLVSLKINDKWGFVDKTGKIIIEPEFEYAYEFREGLASVMLNGKFGVIDNTGKIICKPQFDSINNFTEGLLIVRDNGKYGLINSSGKIIIEPKFDYVSSFSEGLISIKVDGKYGVIDSNGKMIIEPKFDSIGNFIEGLASIRVNGKYGVIDNTGKVIVEPKFIDELKFSEGLASAWFASGKFGVIDNTGKITCEPKFGSMGDFSGGLARVHINNKYGFIDKTGKIIVEPQFDSIGYLDEGLASVLVDGKYGFIDNAGKIIIEPKFDSVSYFSEGLASVYIDGKYKVIDKTGKTTIESPLGSIGKFSEGLASISDSTGKYGIIDKTGKIIIQPKFDFIDNFSKGLASILVDGKYGAIDNTGKIIIEPKFDAEIGSFNEGLASVLVNGKYGFINNTGIMVIKPQFDGVSGFSDGLARVYRGSKRGSKSGFIMNPLMK